MNALLSPIDSESRESHRAMSSSSSEGSPLLEYRLPGTNRYANVTTIIVAGCLLFAALSGALIGVYLLVLQVRSDNGLPPVGTPRYVRRADWDKGSTVRSRMTLTRQANLNADCVVILQTDNGFCDDIPTCAELIKDMESQTENNTLPYNYIISNEGDAYEYLGWTPSTFVPDCASVVFAFIGNYTHILPKKKQLVAIKSIINEWVTKEHLAANYTLLDKNLKDMHKIMEDSAAVMMELDHLIFGFLTGLYSDLPEEVEQ